MVRTSPGRSVITKLIFSRFSSAYPKYTLYFNVPKSSHISPSCSSARTASSNQPITNVYKLTLCLSVHNVIQLLLLSTLRPAPVTSDVASISGYFRRCVHLQLLPTLRPLTALRTQYQPLHAANVPTPHDHSQQNQAPPHALLNTVLFS